MRKTRKENAVERIFQDAKVLFEQGVCSQQIILFLKESGISQGLTSLLLQQIGVGSPEQCKRMVVDSDAWSDRKDANDHLHKAIDEFLNSDKDVASNSGDD